MKKHPVRIGTRKSQLALWQANHVRDLLLKAHPDLEVTLVEISTKGDLILDKPLRDLGGKGLFLKEIEEALLKREIDLAVHSLKDVPYELPEGLQLGALLARADARDALVLAEGATIDGNISIGTGSLRRRSQLACHYPEMQFADIRGNVDTRLQKMQQGKFDGLVLAVAGLQRLGLGHKITQIIQPDIVIPAAGQGIICIEVRVGDKQNQALILALHDKLSAKCAQAERAFTRSVGGDCSLPIGAWGRHVGAQQLHISACIADMQLGKVLKAEIQGDAAEATALGQQAAERIFAQGGDKIMAQYKAITF